MASEKLKKVIRLPYLDDGYVEDIIKRFNKGLNKGRKIIFNVPNTKGMTSDSIRNLPKDALVRVAGGYRDEYVDYIADCFKDDKDGFGDWVFDCVVYNKDELADILQVVENIEQGIDKNWSEKKRAVYLYKSIMDSVIPYIQDEVDVAGKYLSNELRSLRGFVNKISVCGGFALMFKELCDRNDVQCNMVLGDAGAGDDKSSHAWNELIIDGEKYPVDLMWDVGRKYQGEYGESWEYFGRDIDKFNKEHEPNIFYKDNMENKRRAIQRHITNSEMRMLRTGVGTSASVEEAYAHIDAAGNKTVFGQIGSEKIGHHPLYKYLVMKEKDGVWSNPQVVVSDSCVSFLLKYIDGSKVSGTDGLVSVLNGCCELFSDKNLERSRNAGTCYIGGINIHYKDSNRTEVDGNLQKPNLNSYKARKYGVEKHLKELPTGTRDGMCVQLVGKSHREDGVTYKYNCYRFVMNPTKTGQVCRMRVLSDSFESGCNLQDITTEEVMSKADFDTALAFACGQEPVIEK